MNNNGNDIDRPQNNFFGDAMSEDEFLNRENGEIQNDWEDEDYEHCEVYDAVMRAIFLSRPLGILWEDSLIEKFLQAKGYKIIERTDEDGEVYTVPVKVGSKIIPDRKDSLRRIFDQEIQETLINWLIKLG